MKNSFHIVGSPTIDSYALFRCVFELSEGSSARLNHVGASWYRMSLDGEYLAEGPARFSPERPEYLSDGIRLAAGKHVLAIQVHYEGVETRILKVYDPFLWIEIEGACGPLELNWKGLALNSCKSGFRRINPQLAWVEFRDTRKDLVDWESLDFDDRDWSVPEFGVSKLSEPDEAKIASPFRLEIEPNLIGEGPLATRFGYADDDPSYTFYSRDRVCEDLPATVSLIDILPTLADLCGLPTNKQWEGRSIRPLIEDPSKEWDYPALTTWQGNNVAVQTEQYRYIHYIDGSEELYDHEKDLNEWTNLAKNPEYASLVKKLKTYLPKTYVEKSLGHQQQLMADEGKK